MAREQAIEDWALGALQDGILQGGCLGDERAAGQPFFRHPVQTQTAAQVLAGIDLRQFLQATLQGGAGRSAPGPERGLVNLDTYFWIAGATVPQEQTYELAGLAEDDDSGRTLVYQYVLDVGLTGVTWYFGDGTRAPGDIGRPYPAESNPHRYTTISARGCQPCAGGRDVVSAVEHYGVNVTALWFDGGTYHSEQLPPLTDDVPAAAGEDLYVGQLEGVPVGN